MTSISLSLLIEREQGREVGGLYRGLGIGSMLGILGGCVLGGL
jgi:hypothetical protein